MTILLLWIVFSFFSMISFNSLTDSSSSYKCEVVFTFSRKKQGKIDIFLFNTN